MGNCWSERQKRQQHTKAVEITDEYVTSDLAGGKVTLITTTEKWNEMLSEAKTNGKMVVVNFSASWSTPCRFIATPYRNLADKYDSLVFLTVDVDKLAEFSTSWNIKATPTFFFLKNGRAVDTFVGANEKQLIMKTEAAAANRIQ